MTTNLENNKAEIGKLSEEKITSLLLQGFSSDGLSGFTSLWFADEPSVAIQLQYLFEELDPQKGEEFKNATVRAIEEWRVRPHGVKALKELVYLAACIRASKAIKHLRSYLEGMELKALEREEYVEPIIVALQSFAPDDEVRDLFERLLFNNKFQRLADRLFLGLCECQPNEYPKYIQRFLELNKINLGAYRLDFTIRKFERTVTLKTIVDNLHKLDSSNYIVELLDLLCLQPWSPISLLPPDPETKQYFLVSKKTPEIFRLRDDIQEAFFERDEFSKKIVDNGLRDIKDSGGTIDYIKQLTRKCEDWRNVPRAA
jgi:hypothetical protein